MPAPPPPRRACSTPRCGGYALLSRARCAGCQGERDREAADERGSASSRGYGANWRRLRLLVLNREPLCRRCERPATDVDHILPRSSGGTDDPSNLQALCHACHSSKTSTEDGGGFRRRAPAGSL